MDEGRRHPLLVLATEAGEAGGLAASAAAVAVLAASDGGRGRPAPVVVAEVGARGTRGPTMLASGSARALERSLVAEGLRGAARGQVCWLSLDDDLDGLGELEHALGLLDDVRIVIATMPPALVAAAIGRLDPRGALLRSDLRASRPLAALAVMELRASGLVVRIDRHGCGPLAARRALAGLDPGGAASGRARRAARAFLRNGARDSAHAARHPRAAHT